MTTININLLGGERRERRRIGKVSFNRATMIATAVIVGAISASLIGTTILNTMLTKRQAEKEELNNTIKALDKQLAELTQIEQKMALLEQQKKILEYISGNTFPWSKFLNEVRSMIPEDLWISGMSVDASGNLSLSGTTFDYKSVALFLVNLQSSESLKSARLDTTARSGETVTFKITCTVNM